MAIENLATEFSTTLSGNGGSITSTATSFSVAASLPSGLSAPFRAVIYAAGAATGEIVLVGAVSGTTWSSVSRGQETNLGAPAAATHNDGDTVACVLTAAGIYQLGFATGVVQSYSGKNAIGASQYGVPVTTGMCKKITLASAGLLAEIGAYVTGLGTGYVSALSAAVRYDNAGMPGILLSAHRAQGIGHSNEDFYFGGAARWLNWGMGIWLPAGTYWIEVARVDNETATTPFNLAYDTGGTDVNDAILNNGTYIAFQDNSTGQYTTTTRDYSIRASVIR